MDELTLTPKFNLIANIGTFAVFLLLAGLTAGFVLPLVHGVSVLAIEGLIVLILLFAIFFIIFRSKANKIVIGKGNIIFMSMSPFGGWKNKTFSMDSISSVSQSNNAMMYVPIDNRTPGPLFPVRYNKLVIITKDNLKEDLPIDTWSKGALIDLVTYIRKNYPKVEVNAPDFAN